MVTGKAAEERRVARCLAIVFLLNDTPHTRADLARHFQVSERTITTDLLVLRNAGVHITHQRPEGYRAWLPEPRHKL